MTALSPEQTALHDAIISQLRTIFDPEIPVNIYDLGLIYRVEILDDEGSVYVQMTLTTPGCPVAQTFPQMIQEKVLEVEGVSHVKLDLVWDPPWTKERIPEEIRIMLGF